MTRQRFIILLLAALLIDSAAFSQTKGDGKKEPKETAFKPSATIKTVRSYIKAQNYTKANDEVNAAFSKYPEARLNTTLYDLQFNSLHQLILADNKKMYLNTKTDTAVYFSNIYKMYVCGMQCDSVESIPDSKGRIEHRHRDTHAQRLIDFRKNLGASGRFFYRKKDYKNAYKYLDFYYQTKHIPLLTKGKYQLPQEDDSVEIASLATISAYGSQNYEGVKKYIETAVDDTAHRAQLLELGANAYYALADSAKAIALLRRGFDLYPENEVFYLALVKYYNEQGCYRQTLLLTDSLLSRVKPTRNMYFIRGKVQDMLQMPDSAIVSYNKAIELDPNDAESYSALGNIYLSMGQQQYNSFNVPLTNPRYSKKRKAIMDVFSKSRGFFESARRIDSKNKHLWFDGLRDVYYRLNLGKELRELEKIH